MKVSNPRMRAAILGTALSAVVLGAAQTPSRTATSGLDLRLMDASVRPQDDVFRYVNGGWLAQAAIPAERTSISAFTELVDQVEVDLRGVIEDVMARPNRRRGSEAQQIADMYLSLMDEARIETLGAAPIKPELARIEAVTTPREFAAEAGHLTAIGAGGPFGAAIATDVDDPARLMIQIEQGGTLMADRDYYLNPDPKFADIRRQYAAYLATIFRLVGRPRADSDALAVLAVETAIANAEWSRVDSRNAGKTSNRFAVGQLSARMPGFDWMAWAKPQGIDRLPAIVISQPSFFTAFAALVPVTPLETWKAWLTARYVTDAAPLLSQAFSDARFDFFGRVLVDQEAPRARWKRAVGLVSVYLGDAVGRLYVQKHFPPAAKARITRIAENEIAAYRQAVKQSDWMSSRARDEALRKLATLATRIGYPDEWRDYSGLVITPGDLIGNVQRAKEFDRESRLARLLQPDDRDRWLLTPQTVNAYYSPGLNEIVFPAAILQPPLFQAGADDAVNYGAIGAIIGHEIGHALDGHGRVYDASGAVRDWWTPSDVQQFQTRTRPLVAQFDAYSPLPGMHVNGAFTLDENVGDLGGLAIAFRAYLASLKNRPSPVLDGFTGEQRFFLGWAQVWRSKERDGYLRQRLLTIPYAPGEDRANGPVSHIDGFYAAFGVQPGDALYRAPQDRVRIW